MRLLELMSLNELKETTQLLRKKLYETTSINGYSHERTIDILQRFELYMDRYYELKNNKEQF